MPLLHLDIYSNMHMLIFPGLIIIQEWWGVTDFMLREGREFALKVMVEPCCYLSLLLVHVSHIRTFVYLLCELQMFD